MTATTLGERVRLAREARGLTQAELARAAGLGAVSGVASVSRYERGAERTRGSGAAIAPTAAVLARLAAALGVSVEWLLLGTGRGPRAHAKKAT